MTERRRSARFALTSPMHADVTVLHDVDLVQTGLADLSVLSATAGVRGEELMLQIRLHGELLCTCTARTVKSEPQLRNARVMHRVDFEISAQTPLPPALAADAWRSGERPEAHVIRRRATRVLNLSRGGCLLELSARLPVGTLAALQRPGVDGEHDPVRINSLHERRGVSWRYVAGAEFLSLAPSSSESLRSLAGRIEIEHGHAPRA